MYRLSCRCEHHLYLRQTGTHCTFPQGRKDVVAGAVVMLANELLQVLRCLFTVIFWSMNKTDNELTRQLTVGHLRKKWWAT